MKYYVYKDVTDKDLIDCYVHDIWTAFTDGLNRHFFYAGHSMAKLLQKIERERKQLNSRYCYDVFKQVEERMQDLKKREDKEFWEINGGKEELLTYIQQVVDVQIITKEEAKDLIATDYHEFTSGIKDIRELNKAQQRELNYLLKQSK